MTSYTRHGDAPIVDGETASGTEMEAEFTSIQAILNGGIDDANIASGANIDGDKIGTNTLPGASIENLGVTNGKVAASTLEIAKLTVSATNKVYIETSATSDLAATSVTTSGTLVNVDGLSGLTVVPGQSTDWLVVDFTAMLNATVNTLATYGFALNVNGTATDILCAAALDQDGASFLNGGTVSIHYAVQVPTASSFTVQAQYARIHGSGAHGLAWGPSAGLWAGDPMANMLRCQIIPVK